MSFVLNDKKKLKVFGICFGVLNLIVYILCYVLNDIKKMEIVRIILIFVFSIFWWIRFFCLYDMYVIFVVIENGNIIKVCIK